MTSKRKPHNQKKAAATLATLMQPAPEGQKATAVESADPDAEAVAIERARSQRDAVMLEQFRASFQEAGEQYALMQAIAFCVRYNITIPEWAAVAFLHCFDTVHNYRAKSWDEVFGQPLPKGANLNAARKRLLLTSQVYNAVHDIKKRNPKRKIDAALFEVGKLLHIGKRLAKECYYAALRQGFPAPASKINQPHD